MRLCCIVSDLADKLSGIKKYRQKVLMENLKS
jgi:hypothetical protein